MFRRLSVFVSGFTLEAAEAVCAQGGLRQEELLGLLGRLVDKSLVIVEADSVLTETRYRFLETIHQYALERLVGAGEAQTLRDRHSEHFLKFVEEAAPRVFGKDSATWFKRLLKELDNIRAATEWSTQSGNAILALRILGALVNFWFVYGPLSEWLNRVREALSRPEGLQRTTARSRALSGIGFLYWVDRYPVDVRPELDEALEIAQELGDKGSIASALCSLGLLAGVHGAYSEARSYLLRSLETWREIVPLDKMEVGRTLMYLGDGALAHDEMEEARSYYEESTAGLREFGDLNLLAYSVRRLGLLAWRGGEFEVASRLCRESLGLNQETGDYRGVLACVAGFGAIATANRDDERAAVLVAAVESQLALTGTRLLPVDKMEHERNLALLRAAVDERELAKYWAEGAEMTLEQAIGFALGEARA
jgi:non-specific serine/threonine protein kinase